MLIVITLAALLAAPSSPRLTKLAHDLGGLPNAESLFWEEVKSSGTPLVEPIAETPDEVLVTFLYRGDPKTTNVVLIGGPKFSMRPNDNAFEKLPATSVWFLSRRIRRDARFYHHHQALDERGRADCFCCYWSEVSRNVLRGFPRIRLSSGGQPIRSWSKAFREPRLRCARWCRVSARSRTRWALSYVEFSPRPNTPSSIRSAASGGWCSGARREDPKAKEWTPCCQGRRACSRPDRASSIS